MIKYSFSSIVVTLVVTTLTMTISVVQAAPGLRIVGGSESTKGDYPYFGKQTNTSLLLSPSFRTNVL